MRAKNLRPYRLLGVGFVLPVLISGCAGALSPQQAEYEKLPGSGDRMADGPGLVSSQKGDDYDGGYTIYSKDPSKQSLVRSIQSRGQPSTSVEQADRPGRLSADTAGKPTANQQQNYEEFERYQQFKRFQRMPENSAEYQRFHEWQEWKQYQQWRKQDAARQ